MEAMCPMEAYLSICPCNNSESVQHNTGGKNMSEKIVSEKKEQNGSCTWDYLD